MAKPVLVAYATRFGSTAEIAEEIARVLREERFAATANRMLDVASVDGYEGVVIGSPVHRGHWLPEAVAFVHRHQERLHAVALALFCAHISSPSEEVRKSYLDEVLPLLQPMSVAFFPGRFDRRGAALLIPKPLSWLVPPIDRRNWSAIQEWARQVAARLGDRDVDG